ncbi:hypothetical protein BC940DRAFT_248433 [Gongronella butleri]|nr:hypothetical protein BC940DRAFT_248433 [Gongronella butleri]
MHRFVSRSWRTPASSATRSVAPRWLVTRASLQPQLQGRSCAALMQKGTSFSTKSTTMVTPPLTSTTMSEPTAGDPPATASAPLLVAFRHQLEVVQKNNGKGKAAAAAVHDLWDLYEQIRAHNRANPSDAVVLSRKDYTGLRSLLWEHKQWGNEERVLTLLDDMAQQGLAWTVLEYNEYFLVLLYQARYQDILDTYNSTPFQQSGVQLSSGSFNALLATYIQLGHEKQAKQLIENAAQHGVIPDIRDFARSMHRCLPHEKQVVQTGRAWIARYGFSQVDVLNANLSRLFKRQMVDEALWVHEQVEAHGHAMDFTTYSLLICNLIDAKKLRLCATLYKQMRQQGLAPDRPVCSAMLSLYAHRRQLEPAEAAVRDMVEAGHTLNEVIYNQLIKVYFKCRRMDKAVMAFDALQKDKTLKVNDIVLNTMVDGLVMNRQLKAAHALYQQILAKSNIVRPDRVTFNTLLKGFVAEKDYVGARTVIQDMARFQCTPDMVTFTTVINSLFDIKQPADTAQLLATLKQMGMEEPNIYTFNAIINGWVRAGQLQEAEQALAMASSPSYKLQPTIHTYTNLLQGYAEHMDLPKLMTTFQTMMRVGVKPDRAAYHYLIHGLIAHARHNEALTCLKHMRQAQINPTTDTWRILLDGFVKAQFHFLVVCRLAWPRMAGNGVSCMKFLLLYIFGHFLDLPDLWQLLQVNGQVRRFAMDSIQKRWKIDMRPSPDTMMKIQCRGALIALESLSRQLCLWHDRPLPDDKLLQDLMVQEEQIHARVIRGITSYKHKYVLIEDIDIRNRIRATVDVVFHHAVFVAALTRHAHDNDHPNQHPYHAMHRQSMAAMMVRLMTRLDAAFPSYCREITYTLADHIKAFLEYTGYKLLMQSPRLKNAKTLFEPPRNPHPTTTTTTTTSHHAATPSPSPPTMLPPLLLQPLPSLLHLPTTNEHASSSSASSSTNTTQNTPRIANSQPFSVPPPPSQYPHQQQQQQLHQQEQQQQPPMSPPSLFASEHPWTPVYRPPVAALSTMESASSSTRSANLGSSSSSSNSNSNNSHAIGNGNSGNNCNAPPIPLLPASHLSFLMRSSRLYHAHKHLPLTLHSMAACFDLMGTAFIGKILGENHIECAIQRTCELLSDALVPVKKALLLDLLEGWLSVKRGLVAGELCRLVRSEIQKCDRPLSASSSLDLYLSSLHYTPSHTAPVYPRIPVSQLYSQQQQQQQQPTTRPQAHQNHVQLQLHRTPPHAPAHQPSIPSLPSFLLEQRPSFSPSSSSSSSSETTIVPPSLHPL